jgi:aspartyl-tRNA synthetase
MRKRTLSDALVGHEGERVVLRGWVHRRRRLSSVRFSFFEIAVIWRKSSSAMR